MKIVVTGATGNVGTSVTEALALDQSVSEVVGIARRKPAFTVPGCTFVERDVTTGDLSTEFRGARSIIHLAWLLQPLRDPEKLERVNVDGTRRVLDAALEARVDSLVVASSVGAYSPGPKERFVDESWPTEGVATSLYSRQKVEVERMLDRFEKEHPEIRVVRLRPALIFKSEAGAEIQRLFVGRWLPASLLHPDRIPIVPDIPDLRIQCIHSLDVGRAFTLAALSDVKGAINLAAAPVLDARTLAEAFEARRVPLSPEGRPASGERGVLSAPISDRRGMARSGPACASDEHGQGAT